MNDLLISFDDVDEHGPQSKSAVFEFSPSDLARIEIERIGEVAIDATVSAGDAPGEYVGRGEVRYSADLSCARCLDPYPVATVSPFAVRFRPRPAASTLEEDLEIEIGEEDLDVEHYTERSVSLKDLAAEQIHLSIPMKPLCDEDCLGLCPTCGTNLNREPCSCASPEQDDRWGALREIREQIAQKKQN
jgi:uncharacterized protein